MNFDAVRCDRAAGHDGDHTNTIKWGDDELYDPDQDTQYVEPEPPAAPARRLSAVPAPADDDGEAAIAAAQAAVAAAQAERTKVLPMRCAACSHPWHDGDCIAIINDQGNRMPCGCVKAVE